MVDIPMLSEKAVFRRDYGKHVKIERLAGTRRSLPQRATVPNLGANLGAIKTRLPWVLWSGPFHFRTESWLALIE